MTPEEALSKVSESRVGTLASVDPEMGTHQVPVVFVVQGDTIWVAVDDKPKSTRRLKRLANIESDPRVSLLVHHYDEDWASLWWVRVDGRATVLAEPNGQVVESLRTKYPQYRSHDLGPWIAITIERSLGWSSS